MNLFFFTVISIIIIAVKRKKVKGERGEKRNAEKLERELPHYHN